MSATSIDRRQGSERVAFVEPVQVLPGGGAQQIWARGSNLSESGIFVASNEVFGVGTPIGLRLPLPPGEAPVTLRGRVVRVSTGPRPGMGIAFEQIGQREMAALRRAVIDAQPLGWVRQAKVWFAGTSQPTRVQARLSSDGLRLFCDLGFLRLGTPIVLYFPDEETRSYTGILEAATLATDPERAVPRLELSMALDGPTPEAGETWTYWPPPEVMARAQPVAVEEVTAELALPEPSAAASGELEVSDADVIVEAALPEPGEEVYELPLQAASTLVEEAPRVASGAIDVRELPSPSLRLEPSVELVEPPSPAPLEATAEWDLGSLPAAEQSQWSMQTLALPLARKKRRRPRVWMWLLALLMTGFTVASMTYTNLWERVADRLLRPRPAAQSSVLIVPTASPAPVRPVRSGSEGAPAAASTTSPAGEEPATDEASEAAAASSEETTGEPAPAPGLEPRGSTLIIPIEGSLASAHHYQLAQPDGVAVNLPHARPKIRFGSYRVQRGGFRVVWVRRRVQGGLHVRVLHEPGSVAEVRLSSAAVQVTLKPTPSEPPAEETPPAP